MKLKKYLLSFLINFSFLNFLIIVDGNISLRYLYDDVSRLLILGQDFFITPIHIVFIVSIISVSTAYYLDKKINLKFNLLVGYFYNFIIITFSTLIIFYFLRIYDVSRFLLILFLLIYPIIKAALEFINLEKIRPSLIIAIVGFGVVGNFFINSSGVVNKALGLDRNLIDAVIEEGGEVIDPVSRYLNFSPTSEINEGIPKEIKLSLDYKLIKHQICCFEYSFYENGGKSVGYLEIYDGKLLYATGSGILLFTEKPDEKSKQIQFTEIKSNIEEVIMNSYVFDTVGWESIKDILIVNDDIYVSYIEEVANDCVNNAIIKANFNFEYLTFEKFFKFEECVLRSVSPFNAHQSGGKLLQLSEDELILTTGDLRAYSKPQDPESKFGKILKINLTTGSDQIISLGHRNPQGIVLSQDSKNLLITEHGPKGGDEINIIDLEKVQNYGWPISSYGTHYDGTAKADAPLYKSHESYGFVEPIWYFEYEQNDIHGISDVEKDYSARGDNYLVATLKGNIIYQIEVDFQNSEVTNIIPMKVGARVRDIKYDSENELYYLIMENTPSLGILIKYNK